MEPTLLSRPMMVFVGSATPSATCDGPAHSEQFCVHCVQMHTMMGVIAADERASTAVKVCFTQLYLKHGFS